MASSKKPEQGIKIFLRVRPTKKDSGRFHFDDDRQHVECDVDRLQLDETSSTVQVYQD